MAIEADRNAVVHVELQIGATGTRGDVVSVVIPFVSLATATATMIVPLTYRLTPDRLGAQGLEAFCAGGFGSLTRLQLGTSFKTFPRWLRLYSTALHWTSEIPRLIFGVRLILPRRSSAIKTAWTPPVDE